MTPRREPDFDQAELRRLRLDYESGAEALDVLAARFRLSRQALSRLARRLDFGERPKLAPFTRRATAPSSQTNAVGASVSAPRKKPAPAGEPAVSKSGAAAPKAQARAALKPLDLAAAAQRIQSAAGRQLTQIEDKLEAGQDVERHARALASLVKSLGDLARLEEALAGRRPDASAAGDPDGAGDGSWSLDDLRATLARRIDLLAPDPEPLE